MRAKILNASAGSGKTYQLAYKYVRDVIDQPGLYRHILAVTFTNKATEEMKSRILKEIHRLASGGASPYLGNLCRELSLDERSVRKRAAEVRSKILHDYSRFTVLTIDTFFQRILRAFIKELGIDLNYNVEIETASVLSKGADTLIEQITVDRDLQRWLTEFVQERIDEGRKWDIRDGILSLGGELFKEKNKDALSVPRSREELGRIVSRAAAQAEATKKQLQQTAARAVAIISRAGLTAADFSGKSRSFANYFFTVAAGELKPYGATVAKMAAAPEGWGAKGSPAQALATEQGFRALVTLEQFAKDTSKAFNFTVTLGDTGINGTFGEMTFADGVATFVLKHGESKTAVGLPAGITYTVTEAEADKDGYTTTSVNASGSIIKDDTAAVTFTNTRNSSSSHHSTRYTLHYESNGGTAYKDERYSSGTKVTLDKTPTRESYTFTGWYADKELTQKISSIKMTSEKTVYAGWKASTVPDMLNGDDHYAYVVGYSDGTVRPNANISRAEVATIFFRLLKKEVRDGNLTTENIFADVTNGQWHNKAISTMAKLGIVKGRRADSFDPDASITRAEFAAICARFNTKPVENSGSFSDISGHWAENEIERAAAFGWISGYPDGTFRPDARITRAEAMTMINRVLCRMPQSESDLLDSMVTWPDNKPSDWHYLAVQEATNSHDFDRKGEVGESWTKLTSVPDWKRYK